MSTPEQIRQDNLFQESRSIGRVPTFLIEPEISDEEEQKLNRPTQDSFEKNKNHHYGPSQVNDAVIEQIQQYYSTIQKRQEEIHPTNIYSELEKFLLFQVNPKKQQIKNTNMKQFIINKFMRFYKDLQQNHENSEQYINFIEETLRKIVKQNTKRKQLKPQALNYLFGNSYLGKKVQKQRILKKKARRQMFEILEQPEMIEGRVNNEAIKNGKNRKQYLVFIKIFKLRCRMASLVERTQTK